MAIDDIIKNAAQHLAAAVDTTPPDVTGLRRHLTDRLDECLSALQQGNHDTDWLSRADGDTIAFSPRTESGQPLLLNGKTTTFWPLAETADAIVAFRAAVERGAFDDQLASGGQPTVSPKIEGEQRPADPDNGSLSTGGGRTGTDEKETRFTEHLGVDTAPRASDDQ